MQRPSTNALPPELLEGARFVAARLKQKGRRGWIVGGAVRDLALGRTPRDVDMAAPARPEEIEDWFEHTHPVGRAFGTVLVHWGRLDIQLTSFRTESSYSDGRRPDAVAFGESLEEDALRRDFTCNALYLDPLEDALADPTGGLADLEGSLLRCVGDPRRRFAEDGLRLFRLARLAGSHQLRVESSTWEAAQIERGRVRDVSPERILAELIATFERSGAVRSAEMLLELGLLEIAVRNFRQASGQSARVLRALAGLPDPPGSALGLAVLFEPGIPGTTSPGAPDGLVALKPARALARRTAEIREIAAVLLGGELTPLDREGGRSSRMRLVRREAWREGLTAARAWAAALDRDPAPVERMSEFAADVASDLHPEPFVTSADLSRLGVERGPRWGALLSSALDLQLDQRLQNREEALRWLEEQISSDHDGGNIRRNP